MYALTCVCACVHTHTTHTLKGRASMDLRESKGEYIGEFGRKKGKGERVVNIRMSISKKKIKYKSTETNKH